MRERRRSLRFVPSQQVLLSFFSGGKGLDARLSDLSSSGLMTLVAERDCRHMPPGALLNGFIEAAGQALAWEGRVIHQSPNSHGVAVGIAVSANASRAMRQAAEWFSASPHAGALQLRQADEETVLEVIGRLSFEMSHDFLHLIRCRAATRISLSRCTSMDSAGIGMLSIARDLRLPINGATGTVRSLLDVTRIIEADTRERRTHECQPA